MTGSARAKFGFFLPMGSYRDSVKAATIAESLQLDSIWVYDDLHGFPYEEVLEPLTIWAAVAQATKRISLGSGVIAIQRHHPVTLSKALATVDHISGGRIICGIGAGGSDASYGFPAVPMPALRMKEAIEVMKSLWTEERTNYTGTYYEISDARLVPKPLQKPHPPIWLGANNPRTMRLVGEIADGWLPMTTTPKLFNEDLEYVREHAEMAGRRADDIHNGLLLYTLVGKDSSTVKRDFEPLARPTMLWLNGRSLRRLGYAMPKSVSDAPSEVLMQMAAYGTPQDVVHSIGAFIDAGVEHFVLGVMPPGRTEEQMRIFAEEVLPLL